jgi:DNA-binding response OmpR family regulator
MDVLFVGDDLMARARVEDAAKRSGARVEVATLDEIGRKVGDGEAVVLVDLDRAGADGLAPLSEVAGRTRVIGYFSHVDEELGKKAQAEGVEALPRGRFWRELPSILAGG